MLSIEEAKKILGTDGKDLSDEQIQDLLDLFLRICNFAWNKQMKENKSSNCN